MNGRTVAVFGGTGQTGRAVAFALNARGAEARLLSRQDLTNGPAVLEGCDVAYLIAPNMHLNESELIEGFLGLLRCAGIARVVYHSVTAPFVPAMAHHLAKAASEDLVRRSGLDWTILQPCAYMQNFFGEIKEGFVRVPFRTDAPFGLIDLHDVGAAAAAACTDEAHVGATYELGGPELVTIDDLSAAATRVTGRAVRSVVETVDMWVLRAAASMTPAVRERYVDMWNYYDAYGLPAGGASLEAILRRPGRSLASVIAITCGAYA